MLSIPTYTTPHTQLFLRYSRHKPRIVFKAAYGHNDNHLEPRRGLDFTARTTTCVIMAVSRFSSFCTVQMDGMFAIILGLGDPLLRSLIYGLQPCLAVA